MSIRQLLEEGAATLAAHDGTPVTIMHLHAAGANLVADIRRETDALAAGLRPAGSEVAPPAPPEAVPEPADASAASAQAEAAAADGAPQRGPDAPGAPDPAAAEPAQ